MSDTSTWPTAFYSAGAVSAIAWIPRRFSARWAREPGHEPKSGWEFRLSQPLPCFCLHPGMRLGDFRVAFRLCFKASPRAKPFMETSFIHTQIWVHLHVNKTNFHMKGFAPGLALKQRRKATRKSAINLPKISTKNTWSPRGTATITVEFFLRREDIRWLEWNTHYKYNSKDTHFRWKIKWRLELLSALGIMGIMNYRWDGLQDWRKKNHTKNQGQPQIAFMSLFAYFHS